MAQRSAYPGLSGAESDAGPASFAGSQVAPQVAASALISSGVGLGVPWEVTGSVAITSGEPSHVQG
jgi:hypothetical protein